MMKSSKTAWLWKKLAAAMAILLFVFAVGAIFSACTEEETPAEPTVYTITVSASEHGSVTPSVTSAAEGSTVTLTVAPETGYRLKSLKVNGDDITAAKSFTMPAAPVTVTSEFELAPSVYTVSVGSVTNGVVTPSVTSAAAGTTVTVTVTPNTGYKLSELKMNGTDIKESRSFTMPAENAVITAAFVAETYTVSVGACENGAVSVGASSASFGSTVTVTATPDPGYELVTVKVNGTPIDGLQFTMPAEKVTVTAEFAVIKYSITVAPATDGTLSVETLEVAAGTSVTVTATPDSGFVLKSLTYNDGSDHDITDSKTFTMPAGNVTVTAVFEEIKYSITVTPATDGTLSVETPEVAAGTTVTVTATPDNGFGLKSLIYNDGSDHDITASKTFTMPVGDVTVTAVFEEVYGVTVDGGITHGTVTPDKTLAFAGDTVNLTVAPETNYALKELKFNSNIIDISGTTYSFIMPAEAVTVTARFNTAHAINTSTDGHGALTVATQAAEGVSIAISATPDTGYELATLKWNDGTSDHDIDISGELSFVMPDCEVSVYATFSLIDYTVTVGNCENGTVTANPTSATMGQSITLTSTPNAGYELDRYYYNDGTADTTVESVFDMPAANITVYAAFKAITYTITVGNCENGAVAVDPTSAVMGTSITLTSTPSAGYELDRYYYNNGTADTTVESVFDMPAANITVYAAFKAITYTITVGDCENGTVSVDLNSATIGQSVTLTSAPNAGYELDHYYYNDGIADTTVDASFDMPAANITVYASFKAVTYTITVGNSENGAITANPTSAVMGATVTVTSAPNTGYELTSLKWNDGSTDHEIDISGGLTFTMPASNVTVSASFSLINYTVTIGNCTNGTVAADLTSATMGQRVTLTSTPSAGYELDHYYYNDGTADTTVEAAFDMPAANITVYAAFKPIGYGVTASTVSNGALSFDKTEATVGELITVTATPDTGYELKSLTYNDGTQDVTIDISGALTFVMPAHDVTVAATFGKVDYSIAVAAENGTITVGSTTAQMGDTVTFTAVANDGYGMTALRISYLDGEQTVVEYLRETASFTMPAAAVTVTCDFKPITHISTLDQFTAMTTGALDGYYVLDNDIEFTTGLNSPTAGVAPLAAASGFADERGYTFDKNGTVQAGKAFTGVFDGNGYVLIGMELKMLDSGYQNYYRGLFGYVGESGIVRNFTLRDAKVTAAKESAFIAGVNLGLIENVVIEDNCAITTSYRGIGAAVAYNGGEIKNAICYVQKGTSGEYADTVFADGALAYESSDNAVQTSTFVAPSEDISASMGDGWFYHSLVGTVYGNDSYKKFISVSNVAVYGSEFAIQVYQKTAEDPSFYVWGGAIGNSGAPFDFVRYDGENFTYYERLNDGLDYLATDSVEFGINIGGRYICKAVTLNVGPRITTVNFGDVDVAGDPYPGTRTSRRLNLFDSNAQTGLAFNKTNQAKDGYIAIDLMREVALEKMRLTIGRISKDGEIVNSFSGHVEVSSDNENFTAIGSFLSTDRDFVMSFMPSEIMTVRYIRIVLDALPGGWSALSDIYINDIGDYALPYVTSYMIGTPSSTGLPAFAKRLVSAGDGDETTYTAFNNTNREKNGYIQFDFMRTVTVSALRAVIGRDNGSGGFTDTFDGHVEYSVDGATFTTIGSFAYGTRNFVHAFTPDSYISARFIRIVMDTVPGGWTGVTELYLNDLGGWDKPIVGTNQIGELKENTVLDNMTDGNPDTATRFTSASTQVGGYIYFDLLEEKRVEFIRVLNGYNRTGSDKIDGILEYWKSGDTPQWTEIAVSSAVDVILGTDITTRYLRIRINSVPSWLAVREVYINSLGDIPGIVVLDELTGGENNTGNDMLYQGKIEYALDGDPDTLLWLKNPDDGAHFDVKLTKPTDISALRVLTYGADFFRGTVSYTTDGVTYEELCKITDDNYGADYHFYSVTPKAGVIRLRFTADMSGGRTNWLQIKEIYINTLGNIVAAYDNSGFGALAEDSAYAKILDGDDATYAEFAAPEAAGGTFTVDFFAVKTVKNIAILAGKTPSSGDAVVGSVEVSTDGVNYTALGNLTGNYTFFDLGSPTGVRFIRFINNGSAPSAIREIKTDLMDRYISAITWSSGFDKIYSGSVENAVDKNADTNLYFGKTPAADDYVQLALADEIEISNIYVFSGKPNGGDSFVGKLTYSTDGVTWKDIDGGTITATETTVNLATHVRAKYIRLVNTESKGWVVFREIEVNKAA